MARPTRRPAPVTSATLPRSSTLLGERRRDLGRWRSATRRKRDRAVARDAVDGALDAAPVFLERMIRTGDHAIRITDEREAEAELVRILPVSVHTRRIHTEGLRPGLPEQLDLIAHGGELVVSARGVVAGIEKECDWPATQELVERVRCAVARLRGELRRRRAE